MNGAFSISQGVGAVSGAGIVFCLLACVTELAAQRERRLAVTATAYNSVPNQTNDRPMLGAWGDVLAPGTKSIAVSPDLIPRGLTRGRKVRIQGLPGRYQVLDKMPSRWKKKIDIYMGMDVRAARRWGKRRVQIFWVVAPDPNIE